MIRATLVILAGGKSRRMGRDKATVRWAGRRLVDHVADSLGPLFPEKYVAVGSRVRFPLPRGCGAIRDRFSGAGPLAGVHAALLASRRRFVFAAPCDAPFPSRRLVRSLWKLAQGGLGAVPEGPTGVEPLFAFYGKGLLGQIEQRLSAAPRTGPSALAHLAGVRRLPWREVRRADPAGRSFADLDTPRAIWNRMGPARLPKRESRSRVASGRRGAAERRERRR